MIVIKQLFSIKQLFPIKQSFKELTLERFNIEPRRNE